MDECSLYSETWVLLLCDAGTIRQQGLKELSESTAQGYARSKITAEDKKHHALILIAEGGALWN